MGQQRESIGVIGDLVASRRVRGEARERLQERFTDLMHHLNRQYQSVILARFVVTTGDEFQGLLRDASAIPDLIWEIEAALLPMEARLGFGRGTLETRLEEVAVGMDGPVWHRAREAVEMAGDERGRGSCFVGFGDDTDPTLDALARLLKLIRDGWTQRQRQVAGRLRTGRTHEEIGEELGISRQAVSKHAAAAAWDAYREGEDALRRLLSRHDYAAAWSGVSPTGGDT